MSIIDNLKTIKDNIKEVCVQQGRSEQDVNIVAVTKYVSIETARNALDAGLEHLGENRAEVAVEKWEALQPRGKWHFIGSLQSRKVKQIVGKYQYLHSLDRLSLAKELDKRLKDNEVLNCFIQVNVSGEESKAGLHPDQLEKFISDLAVYKKIRVVGLMTMAPFYEDPELTRPTFKGLRELRDHIQALQLDHAPCTELSMGMSNDFKVAIEEGATYVRIGSALVGRE
ncbi:YggS family pyridoxal phosphate-dependent enzyme [Bacillus suaedae]|uniref:Pyridoxal phosphate homeostasis protein n=1 Tax=Halalkalibacter suaedae TaxID=2822140 RepID=A0A940WWW6_9BACI|nr:YggS family pyridoxal phosphate-dependent enzyme [Bacillus suaedae]MBP3952112.1 YggS family pyridoxal phosphate-dependent enzyme [Bacillus suaedae]